MRSRPIRSFAALVLFCAALFVLRPAVADVIPGDACTGAGDYTVSSGPELSGAGHLMVCTGSVWKSVLDFDATANSILPYAVSVAGDISPSPLSSDQNDFNPSGLANASVLRLSSSAAVNITGLAGGSRGRSITIFNTGTNNIVLKNQNTSSTDINRFAVSADITIGADQSTTLIYDATSQRWRSASIPFNVVAGLSGPSGCSNIGDLCADGTVFAGYNPMTHEQLFIPPVDQGTGAWKTSAGTNDIATDSAYDGRANSNQVANSTTFPAFKLCKDLGAGGYADWYLPSQIEIYYLWALRGTLVAGGNITDFQNTTYWTSTETSNNNYAYVTSLATGVHSNGSKTVAQRVRCVRR